MPQAATFDAQNAIFRWTPTAADAGTQVRVTFAVSDGALSATMDVNLTVEGGSGSNHPPEIPPFSPLEAVVGQLLQFDVQASDPDGDALAFGIEGALPAGAQFDTVAHHFSWIPAADMTGKSATVTFTASDGQYTASAEANILVTAQSAGCSDDGYEPNNNASQAKPLAAGTYPGLSICDTALSPIDEDWFQVGMAAGQQIDATISFNHALGDLDLALFNPAVRTGAVFYAPGVGDVEKVTYVAPSAGTYLLVAFGTISQKYAVPYTLTLALQAGGTTCAADAKEPNDTAPAAF